jgi:peptide chain release factor 1
VGFKAYNLDAVLDGEIEALVQACVDADQAARMASLGTQE